MLYKETIALCSQIHTKDIHTALRADRIYAEGYSGGNYTDHWAVKG